jgi:hypothetical protein
MVVDGFAQQTSIVNKFHCRTSLINEATLTRYPAANLFARLRRGGSLRIETIVTLRRIFKQNKSKLEEYLNEINYLIIDDKIEMTIYSREELSNCKTLDAIHVSTALQYREISEENINLYTFDMLMNNLAKHFKFKTNRL